jgi:hypothetical protein
MRAKDEHFHHARPLFIKNSVSEEPPLSRDNPHLLKKANLFLFYIVR